MFAIDTNILVYAHNLDSEFNEKAAAFLENVMNERDLDDNPSVCIPAQVFTEFISVITQQNLESPLSLEDAAAVVQDYVDSGVMIVAQGDVYVQTFLNILKNLKSRKKIFDVAIAAVLKDAGIRGIYTVNVDDFKEYDFLEVIDPLTVE
jgi:hypothetical protein